MRLWMRLMRHRWKWASHASGRQISLDELADSRAFVSGEGNAGSSQGAIRERSGSEGVAVTALLDTADEVEVV